MKKIIFNEKNIIKKYKEGMESTIYFYRDQNEIIFLKLFKREIKYGDYIVPVSDKILLNKKLKIELIPEFSEFSDEIQILKLVYDEKDNFIGYTMKIDEFKTAKDISRRNLKIDVLKQLRKKMEMFNENDIYIGDFNPSNIIITNEGIKICDLDNFRIGDLDFDLKSLFQNMYLQKCKNIENIDNYSFNLFTISYIGNMYEPYVLWNIRQNGLPRKLNTRQNRVIVEQLIDINDNYQKQYLIDNMRKVA